MLVAPDTPYEAPQRRSERILRVVVRRLEGYVTRLDRNIEPNSAGDVIVVPNGPESGELRRVSVHLDPASYAEALEAHRTGALVQVVGTLRKDGRQWRLADASGFERVPGQDDAGEGDELVASVSTV